MFRRSWNFMYPSIIQCLFPQYHVGGSSGWHPKNQTTFSDFNSLLCKTSSTSLSPSPQPHNFDASTRNAGTILQLNDKLLLAYIFSLNSKRCSTFNNTTVNVFTHLTPNDHTVQLETLNPGSVSWYLCWVCKWMFFLLCRMIIFQVFCPKMYVSSCNIILYHIKRWHHRNQDRLCPTIHCECHSSMEHYSLNDECVGNIF